MGSYERPPKIVGAKYDRFVAVGNDIARLILRGKGGLLNTRFLRAEFDYRPAEQLLAPNPCWYFRVLVHCGKGLEFGLL